MPSSLQAQITRRAISPRLATRIFLNMNRVSVMSATGVLPRSGPHLSFRGGWQGPVDQSNHDADNCPLCKRAEGLLDYQFPPDIENYVVGADKHADHKNSYQYSQPGPLKQTVPP